MQSMVGGIPAFRHHGWPDPDRGLLFVAAFVLSVEHEKTIEGALKQSEGLVTLFEQDTVGVLERIDRTLLFLRKSFEDDPSQFDLRAWATQTALISGETLQLTLIGRDGFQAASTTDYRGSPLYLGDREHFRTQLDPTVDKLFISEPVLGRVSGKMSLQFSRRLRGPDGVFAGVIVISIDPNFIERFYRTMDLGANGTVVLRNVDGVILAAQGFSSNVIGRQVKPPPFLDSRAQSRSGHYWGGGVFDGINRLMSYRASEGFPLIFAVGLAENEILSGYRRHRAIYFAAASIVNFLILIAMAFSLRQQASRDRSQETLKELNEEISKQNVWLDAALTNMPNGLSMFDADGKLLVWNHCYVKIYGMSPDVIRQGVSINTIVEHWKEAGDLDIEVEAYVGKFRQALIDFGMSTSSTRLKDGRMVSVTNTAIAGGGWVGIHEDITDRIRREEEIFDQATELARTSMRFEAALNNMTQGLCLFDADKKLVVANNRFREMYDLPDELVAPGTPLPRILQHHADRGAKSDLTIDEHVEQIPKTLQQNFVPADGREISIKRTSTPEGGWVATHEDVTEQRRQEKLIAEKAAELEIINDRFDAALSNMIQGISMFDGRRQLVVWNARYAEIYQLPQTLLKVGTAQEDIADYIVTRGTAKRRATDADREKDSDAGGHPTDRSSSRIEELNDGRVILLSRQAMSDGGWLTTHEDITERRRAEKEIIHLARHDPLTGLANRAEFNAKLEEATKRLKRNGGAVTVMMLDLDKFKAVNDTLGHPAGDQLLVEVARRLKSSVRETDVLARLGGDEFAIIRESAPNQHEGAIALARWIITAITQPFDLSGQQASVGTSIGIVLAPEHGADPEELLKRADLALYNVKAGGRNDFRKFQPEMLEVVHSQQSAESELRDAIARDEFELHYQPQIDAKTRLLCGVEALVRWQHPTKGLVPPNEFIPLAESTGLIVPLGEWLLQQACKEAASWPANIKVAVNISTVQFKKGNLFDVILCTLVESGLAPERLELEITETALLENQGAHLATIRQLKNLGVSLALDDFGTGHSSINYLTVFPFDKLKIDKSFTQGVLKRREYKAVVASTLALAQGLGTVTTAEGVETEEQFNYMREAGVDLVQGYLFGRPVPASKLDLHDTSLPKEMVA
jgi:diguanylate cyclase (GGDEF)-like protein/PAS domain S-box-containing protein